MSLIIHTQGSFKEDRIGYLRLSSVRSESKRSQRSCSQAQSSKKQLWSAKGTDLRLVREFLTNLSWTRRKKRSNVHSEATCGTRLANDKEAKRPRQKEDREVRQCPPASLCRRNLAGTWAGRERVAGVVN